MSIQVAVIGYGFAGRSFHSYLVGLTPGFALRGIAARKPELREKAKAERNCLTYETFEQVLNDPAVDLVVLATPHDTHAPLAIAALNAGKHVVTDKVMCLSVAECDAMTQASKKSGKLLTVFHNRRWDGDYLTAKKLLDDGALGDVRWIEMAWQKYGLPKTDRWRGQRKAGGGKIYDLGAHLLDQILLMFPEKVTGVFARVHYDFPNADVDSHAHLTLSFEGGKTAIADVSSMAREEKARYYLVGSDATFTKFGVDAQEAAMIAGNIDAAKEPEALFGKLHTSEGVKIIPTQPGRWRNFYENVRDSITGKAEPAVKLPEMRRLLSVIEAAYKSANTNQVVAPQ